MKLGKTQERMEGYRKPAEAMTPPSSYPEWEEAQLQLGKWLDSSFCD
jgi:hypothetical protein